MKSILSTLLLLGAVVGVATADEKTKTASSDAEKAVAKKLASLRLTDINGKQHTPFADKKTRAVALIFVSTDCPIANAFQPALGDFSKAYTPKGIPCFMVYSTTGMTKQRIARHVKDYRITAPAIHDSKQVIGRLVSATVTPEAVLIDRAGAVRYRGLINNLYAGYGRKRASATEHYLRDATNAVLTGKKVPKPTTKPLGCFIHYAKPEKTSKQDSQ